MSLKQSKNIARVDTVSEIDTNAVGGTDMRNNRNSALKAIKKAKEVEQSLIQLGRVWMTLGKTSKLVAPDKVQIHIDMGYRRH